MFYQEFTPSFILQNWIERYWIVETSAADIYPMEYLLTPNGLDGLILQYYLEIPQMYLQAESCTILPANYVLIQPQKSWKLRMPGISGIAGIFFRPGAMQHFLRYPMIELSNKPIELEALMGNRFRVLCEQLIDIEPAGKIRLLDEFFIKLMNTGTRSYGHANAAVKIVLQHKGNLTVQQLSNEVGISRQLISRRFAEKIGISPKHFARIIRFNSLHRFLATQPKSRWVDVTYDFGYFDQSHFIKDFHEFMGLLPTEYLFSPTEMADFYAGKF